MLPVLYIIGHLGLITKLLQAFRLAISQNLIASRPCQTSGAVGDVCMQLPSSIWTFLCNRPQTSHYHSHVASMVATQLPCLFHNQENTFLCTCSPGLRSTLLHGTPSCKQATFKMDMSPE